MRDADREGRVVPDLEIIDGPIHTAWDLGHGSNMAVFAFQIGDDGLEAKPHPFFILGSTNLAPYDALLATRLVMVKRFVVVGPPAVTAATDGTATRLKAATAPTPNTILARCPMVPSVRTQ